MKKFLILFIFMSLTIKNTATGQEVDSLSYSLGVLLGKNLIQQGFDKLNADDLAKAINDVITQKDLMVTPEDANKYVADYQQAEAAKKFAGAKAEGETFLAENKKREGVTTLPSGLQYEVISSGEGTKPAATDKVTVHYHGMLINGTVFDSSVDRGQPASFPVNGVIKGWVEALQLMSEGDKWKLFIPYDLAYGERGAGHDIGPFSTLIFEVELIKIN